MFDDRFVMRGSEPNSALGIHLTEHPCVAAEYAKRAMRDRGAGAGRVLVVEAEIERPAFMDSVEQFLGRPPDTDLDYRLNRTREEFAAARLELQGRGIDALHLATNIYVLAGTWVVFDPARLMIADRMGIGEADAAGYGECFDLDAPWVSLFEDEPEVLPPSPTRAYGSGR